MPTGRLETRIAALEGTPTADREAESQEDAQGFTDTMLTLAGRFSETEGHVHPIEQAGSSPAMRLAWTLRFGTVAECESMLAEVKARVAAG